MITANTDTTAAAERRAEVGPRLSAEEDVLPSFISLTDDDAWEKKAGHQPPGTYYVIANVESFQHLEESRQARDDQDPRPLTSHSDHERPPKTYIGSTSQPPITFEAEQRYSTRANTAIDPETIVLGTVEVDLQRTPHWNVVSPRANPGGTNTSMAQSPALTAFTRSLDGLSVSAVQPIRNRLLVATSPAEQELRLLRHYRNFVSRHIVQIRRDHPDDTQRGSLQDMDIFEQEASSFPPVCDVCIL